MNEFKNDVKIFWRSLRELEVDKKILSLVFITMVLANLLSLMNPVLFGNIINGILEKDINFIIENFVLTLFVFIASILIGYINSRLLIKMTINLEKKIKKKLFDAIMHIPYLNYLNIDKGTLINSIEDDASVYSNLLTNNISLIINIISLVTTFGFMLFISPLLTIILLITFPISSLIYAFTGRKIKKNEIKYRSSHDIYISFLNESMYGWKFIKLFNSEKQRTKDFLKRTDELYEFEINKTLFQINSGIGINLVTFIISNINLIIGIFLILNGNFSLGMLTAFNSYGINFKNSLLSLTQMNSLIQETVVSINRIEKIIECIHPEKARIKDKKIDKKIEKITVENLMYSTANENMVFKNVNIDFLFNSLYVVKGANGAGKSTILNILCGLIENYSGTVLINGIAISEFRPLELRERIKYITQDNYLFSMSIRENIAMYRDVSLKEIKDKCKYLNMDEIIEKLPNGYDTVINERGNDLSGGEKQRICIARAMVEKPDVYLLDEITSGIDIQNMNDIIRIIEKLSKDSIVIMTTHDEIKFEIPIKNCYIENGMIYEKIES